MKRECPICANKNNERISLLCDNMKILGTSFPASNSDTVECTTCGCVYVNMDATQDNFTKYYEDIAQSISYTSIFGKQKTQEYYSKIYAILEEYIRSVSENKDEIRILDVGCAFGEFIEYLQSKNYNNVEGTEISKECIRVGAERGIRINAVNILNIDTLKEERFDIIILSHVLEHIVDCKKALENCKSLLKDTGCIYVEFPDAEKYCNVNMSAYFFNTYEHVMHVTHSDLENFAIAHNLELCSANTYLKLETYYVLYGVYKKAKREEKRAYLYSNNAKKALSHYEDFSKEKILQCRNALVSEKEELILWGIGASTAILIHKVFNNSHVIQLIDANPLRQGIEFTVNNKKLKIESPVSIKNTTATIVVLPEIYCDSIKKQIDAMGYKNNVIALFSKQ